MAEKVAGAKAPKTDAVRGDALEVVRGLSRGDVAFECSEKLAELAKAVRDTGKGGALKLTLKMVPKPDLGVGAMVIEAAVDLALPKPEKKSDVRFVTEDGRLTKDDPAQMTFNFGKEKEAE